MALDAIVVVPARNEAERIVACLEALAGQTVGLDRFEVIVVLDGCHDDTETRAVQAAAKLGVSLSLVTAPGRGTGPARRAGMDLACARLLEAGRPDGLIASTDADSRPAPEWLARQLAHVARGATVIAGRIELDADEARGLPQGVLVRRGRDARERMQRVRAIDPGAGHHHFAGASIGVTAATYESVGGIEPTTDLEDDGFAQRLAAHGVAIVRAADVVVVTSARTDGRATRGLSTDLALSRWLERGRYRADQFSIAALAAARDGRSVTVIIPTRECADTIGGVLHHTVAPLRAAGIVDEVVVIDAASCDGTAQVAAVHGARVLQQDHLCPELGPALGKGDAMWRALHHTRGDIVCFLDGDTSDPAPEHLIGLIGPLLMHPALVMVRGSFDRPLDTPDGPIAHEGGRVTELMARPLLNLFEPLLAGFGQPLAGEFSARRELLEELSFPVGYGVEIATLIDALRARGLDALAQCALGTRQNRHQPLRTLGEMAYAVLAAVERRRAPHATQNLPNGHYVRPWDDDRPFVSVPVDERPPLRDWAAASARPAGSAGLETDESTETTGAFHG
jgi:glucosyl-3-phosphoglycerate synthase